MAVFCASVSQIRLNVFCDTVLKTHHFRHKILQLMTRPKSKNVLIRLTHAELYPHSAILNHLKFSETISGNDEHFLSFALPHPPS